MKKHIQIFLSYASEDKNDVERLYDELLKADYKPWMDTQDLIVGEPWRNALEKAIRESDFFIAVLSAHSVSKRGEFQRELKIAVDILQTMKDNDIFLIPMRLEEVKMPDSVAHLTRVDRFSNDYWLKLTKAFREGIDRRSNENSALVDRSRSRESQQNKMFTTKRISINQIPFRILDRLDSDQVILLTNKSLEDKILGTTTFDPHALKEVDGLSDLVALRHSKSVYSITTSIMKINRQAISEAADGFEHRFLIIQELDTLFRYYQDVYLAYVVTHLNFKPMEELTVFIGGDGYRSGEDIKDLESVLSRTQGLAEHMIRKAVMIFPDIPTLHGGKNGEWIVLDSEGKKIQGLSEEAIVALGTLIIPKGIRFLNDYKEAVAQERGIFDSFPKRNFIRPDTASPDVLSGANWGPMCRAWANRGLDLSYVTCLPPSLGGPAVPSSYASGYGVVSAAAKLIEYYFKDRDLTDIRFVLEALGGVGQATVEALLNRGVRPENITAFDRWAEVCKRVSDKYGINALAMTHDQFYRRLDNGQQYDVWINNGEGNNTLPEHIEGLIESGVRIFGGGANNLFEISRSHESLGRIFDAGAWAWPDEAANGGGWTLAVIDVLTRSRGERSDTIAVRKQILETIISRNEKLVTDVVDGLMDDGKATGVAIWNRVQQIINSRVEKTLSREFLSKDIAEHADVRTWKLG